LKSKSEVTSKKTLKPNKDLKYFA